MRNSHAPAAMNWVDENMSSSFIVNFNEAGRVLVFDNSLASFAEIDRPQNLHDEDLGKGFFVRTTQGVVALIASSIGPLLLIGPNIYRLDQSSINIRLDDDSSKRVVSISRLGELVFRYAYDKPSFGYDLWSSEDMVDFFLWLSSNYRRPTFAQYYTL